MNPRNQLLSPVAHKTEALHHIRIEMWAAYGRDAAVSTGKVQLFIFLDHRLNHRMMGLSGDGQTGGNILIVLKSNESIKIGEQYCGIGLSNVSTVIHKYNGDMKISHNNDVFTVSVMLPLVRR